MVASRRTTIPQMMNLNFTHSSAILCYLEPSRSTNCRQLGLDFWFQFDPRVLTESPIHTVDVATS
jgi:hypothetical protein